MIRIVKPYLKHKQNQDRQLFPIEEDKLTTSNLMVIGKLKFIFSLLRGKEGDLSSLFKIIYLSSIQKIMTWRKNLMDSKCRDDLKDRQQCPAK